MALISSKNPLTSLFLSCKNATTVEKLYYLYNDSLIRFLRKQLDHHEAAYANDIAQEAFCRIARYVDDNPTLEHPRGLLFQIAKHALIDFHRNKKVRCRDHHIALENNELISPLPSQEDIAANQQMLERLESIVLTLPPRCQEVFVLSRFEGLEYKAIASRLGITVSMVEKHIKKALTIIREHL